MRISVTVPPTGATKARQPAARRALRLSRPRRRRRRAGDDGGDMTIYITIEHDSIGDRVYLRIHTSCSSKLDTEPDAGKQPRQVNPVPHRQQ